MKDKDSTREQLIDELAELRQRIAELGMLEIDRKKTAEELRMNTQVLESMIEGVNVSDEKGTILFTNPAFDAMFGYERAELVGKHVTILNNYSEEENTRMVNGIMNQLKTKGHWSGEVSNRRKTGAEFYTLTTVTVLNIDDRQCWVSVQQDITEHRQTQEELRLFMESSPTSFAILDSELNYAEVNKAGLKAFGKTKEEIVGKNILELNPALKGTERYDKYVRVMETGEPLFMDDFVPHPLFGDLHLNVRAFKVGEGLGVIVEDITERMQAEKALLESEENFRALAENANDGIVISIVPGVPDDMSFAYVNGRYAEITGYSVDELIGHSIWDVVPDDVKKLMERDRKRLAGMEVPTKYEGAIVRKDGKRVPVEATVALTTWQGQPAFMSVIRDTTARKWAEEELRESELRYRTVFESAPIGIGLGTRDGRVLEFNEPMCEMTGLSEADLRKLDLRDAYKNPEDRDLLLRILQRDGRIRNFETELKRADGTTYHAVLNIGQITLGGEDMLQTVATDISERKRMEEELLKVQKLESIGVLAGGIAHDLNNLLTGGVGNISLARLYENPSEKDRRLAEAERASMRIKDLTQQLLTFSKGGAPIRKIASIAGLLRDSARFVLRGSNVICEFSIADDLSLVEIDEGQMNQVISNIIINADQVMASGGAIRVSAENTTVSAEHGLPLEAGKYVKISIEDHGIGIPETELPKIFDPFFTTKQAGSGLGLATSYSIVEKHNGHITAESELGVGTTLHIYIPAAPEQVLTQDKREENKPITGEGKILVMDDEEHVREIAAEMVIRLGYKATTAIDGAQTIELYRKARDSGNPFDAVILDLTVPGGMGGQEAIQRLLEIDPEIKAIVSSGYSNNPIITSFEEHGFKGVIAKPYKTRELSEVLHGVITE